MTLSALATFVSEVDIYIDENYINETFKSCINVQFPSSGQLGLDLMCGEWGAAKCTPRRWYFWMGDVTEDYVPFQINYRYQTAKGFRLSSPQVVPCNQSVDVSLLVFWLLKKTYWCFFSQGIRPACSCVDCASSCPKPPSLEEKPEKFLLWGFDKYVVGMFIVFLVGTSTFVFAVLFCSIDRKPGELFILICLIFSVSKDSFHFRHVVNFEKERLWRVPFVRKRTKKSTNDKTFIKTRLNSIHSESLCSR